MVLNFKRVDAGLQKEVDGLINACEKADGFKTEIFTDTYLNFYKDMHCAFTYHEDNRLTGFLFIFAPNTDEVEMTALVSPCSRRKGILKALAAAAVEESIRFGYHNGLFVCNAASGTGRDVMAHYGYPLHHTEYGMRCFPIPVRDTPEDFSLESARMEDIDALAVLGAEIFDRGEDDEASMLKSGIESDERIQWKFVRGGKAIGLCAAVIEGKKCSIYGLGVHPEERRKGYGRIILDLVSKYALANGVEELCLDVDSENPPALSLYRSYGFTDQNAVHYYAFEF